MTEEILSKQLAGIVHKTLFQVFIDVRKSYDSLDRERCTEILSGHGLGNNINMLIQWYWVKQKVVPKSSKLFEGPLQTERGVTEGDPVSVRIFNIVADSVVRSVILEVYGPQEAHNGFGWAAVEYNILFYVENVLILGRNPIWVQKTLTNMVRMFEMMVLKENFGGTKALVCNPGFIRGQQGTSAYKRREMVEGETFLERKRTRVSHEECGGTMLASYLCHRMERIHRIVLTQKGGRNWQKRTGYIHGVFSAGNEVSGVPIIWIPGKGKKPREA